MLHAVSFEHLLILYLEGRFFPSENTPRRLGAPSSRLHQHKVAENISLPLVRVFPSWQPFFPPLQCTREVKTRRQVLK